MQTKPFLSQKLLPRIPGAATETLTHHYSPTGQTPREPSRPPPRHHHHRHSTTLSPSETKTARATHARPATINAPSPLPPLADEPRARPPPQLAFMDRASEELERRSRYLSSLVRRSKLADPPEPEPEPEREREREREVVPKLAAENSAGEEGKGGKAVEAREGKEVKAVKEEEAKAPKGEGNGEERKVAVRVRAADMPLALQRRAIRVALEASAAMPRIDSKRLALALKKEFDTTYGPAWHCIVGTSFGSYVTHSLGGFLYFSVDKVYILLFRTAVEPLSYQR